MPKINLIEIAQILQNVSARMAFEGPFITPLFSLILYILTSEEPG